jgi:hypothetical protein
MLLPRILFLRLGLVLSLALALGALPPLASTAVAQDDDDDDEDEGDDESDGEEEEDEEAEEQPPVTAGGMYTKKTYPVAELERPLTLTQGILQIRGGFDIDVSKDTAFETWRAKLNGAYGIKDHIELQAGFNAVLVKPDGAASEMALELGIETAIAYDLVDFRALVILPFEPDFTVDLALGFPFRYKPKPKVAIIALDKLMTIHTQSAVTGEDEEGEPIESSKPDLTVGVGIVYQAMPQLALLLRGEITIPRFDTDTVTIPATAAVQFSPNNKFDLGGEFTLGNLKAKDPASPFDQRSLLLYLQLRV